MAAISRLPLGMSRGIGWAMGSLLWVINGREAKVTKRNLEICFPEMPEQERLKLAKRSLQETGVMLMETPAVWMRDMAWLRSKVIETEGCELVDEALAKGKGMVLIAPHLGNWEVVGLYAATLGPITSLFEPPKNAEVGAIIQESREKSGATLVPTDRRGVMKLLKAIKAGGISGILPDQVPGDGAGELVEFFGRPAYTMTLLCNLVSKTGCEALVSYAERVPGGFKLVFKKSCPDLYSEDCDKSLRALNRSVEDAITALPEQYQWEYKRYKCFEDGYQDPYTNMS
ncbi:lysophospholipid acyltransferase family protein [uncultured Pseudoteredinibacter sp.]|uniref:lysophospholipid acyltransferase family protein n=1 Tax=uncultured Pseudoteredinibacter sp. TaxID=1641701 RepID=UPI002620282D|nr:lysophospholipid acyltransferase family protein [uncultured Pseudoteredinibacter sp.]